MEGGNNCNGQCHPIYPAQDQHIKQREEDERILGSKGQFCAAFYHVHQWYHIQNQSSRDHFCLDDDNCIISEEAKKRNDDYAWCVQAKTVVAVVKFEGASEILYEARYTNCGKEKKHAEDFFKEDIEKGELGKKVEDNTNGTITLYLTLQPCNKSTSTGGTENTPKDKTCCETLTTIVNDELPPGINLCVKSANTCRLSLKQKQKQDDEILRQNAVAGIKMLMQIERVNVSGMTPEDWRYLLCLTNELENREDLAVHVDRQDLDGSVQYIFNQIQDEIDQA
jgi:hypothetical protein